MDAELNFPHDSELYEHHRLTVDKGQEPMRVDIYLTNQISGLSRTKIKIASEIELVRVNNKPVKVSYKIKPNDEITVLLPFPPQFTEIIPQPIPLDIVYEDEFLLIVNKPAGMVVHPAYGNWKDTLVNGLLYHCNNLQSVQKESPRPGLVHRIDKNTSGLLVVCKTEFSMMHLSKQFFEHSVERKYHALVWGSFPQQTGTINAPLGRNPNDRKTMAVVSPENGKNAVTHFSVIKDFTYTSLIECTLETGRTHQIRAHMNYLRHPVFNDKSYGGNSILKGPNDGTYRTFVEKCFNFLPSQALHAKTLGFIHPVTGKNMFFESQWTEGFSKLITAWEKNCLIF
ncbi:MAG: RNA pseudouridine synthase [Bacteroidetes bacterium RIFCSPLOWO2_02_FULL_36_8]|nr:MAG: RNA pseudouridine synthase [Bacteroidetes bacterium RIFCSPLOWO2_02_FULL_36_8]OFY69233.1 MAG: RNA pseudouridine synthase [Bacteroidetes bacterium RIFCSPLOWO2_12_FULL_37_12]